MMGMRGLHQSLSKNQSFVSKHDTSFMISSVKLSFCTCIFRTGFLILVEYPLAVNLMIDLSTNCSRLIRILQLPYFDVKGQFFPNGKILNHAVLPTLTILSLAGCGKWLWTFHYNSWLHWCHTKMMALFEK